MPTRQEHKKPYPWDIIVKTLSIHNTAKSIGGCKRKTTNHYKGKLITVTAALSRNFESQKSLQ